MVILEIFRDGSKFWYLNKDHYNNGSDGCYCLQYPEGGNDSFYYYGGLERMDCNNKAEYIKLIKLKVLW